MLLRLGESRYVAIPSLEVIVTDPAPDGTPRVDPRLPRRFEGEDARRIIDAIQAYLLQQGLEWSADWCDWVIPYRLAPTCCCHGTVELRDGEPVAGDVHRSYGASSDADWDAE
jgi:hypothetical protein